MARCSQLTLMSTALLAVSLTLQAQEPPTSPGPLYIEALHDHGLSTDLDDLLQYIGRLHPNHQDQQHVQQLIDQLGAEKFHDRREAMFALSEAPELTQVKLAIAEVHTDQEIRRRARSLRKKQRAEGDFVLFATLRTLRLHASPRSVPMLMPLIPQLNDDYLRQEKRGKPYWPVSTRLSNMNSSRLPIHRMFPSARSFWSHWEESTLPHRNHCSKTACVLPMTDSRWRPLKDLPGLIRENRCRL